MVRNIWCEPSNSAESDMCLKSISNGKNRTKSSRDNNNSRPRLLVEGLERISRLRDTLLKRVWNFSKYSWIVSLVSLPTIADSYALSIISCDQRIYLNRLQPSSTLRSQSPRSKDSYMAFSGKNPAFYLWPLYFYLTLNQLRPASSLFVGWSFDDLFRSSVMLDV